MLELHVGYARRGEQKPWQCRRKNMDLSSARRLPQGLAHTGGRPRHQQPATVHRVYAQRSEFAMQWHDAVWLQSHTDGVLFFGKELGGNATIL